MLHSSRYAWAAGLSARDKDLLPVHWRRQEVGCRPPMKGFNAPAFPEVFASPGLLGSPPPVGLWQVEPY
jgi:hypothetical protein